MKLERTLFKNLTSLSASVKGMGAEHRLIHPFREWAICLIVSVSILCVLFGYLGIEFYTQYRTLDTPSVSERALPIYHVADARAIIDTYTERKKEFTSLREERKGSIVPLPIIPENVPNTTPPTTALAEEGAEQYTDPEQQDSLPAATLSP